jgi:hypothetical protein
MTGRIVGLTALCAAVVVALIVTPGFSASFLTKGKAKSLFFTKSQSDSRYLTPGQADAKYLTPSQADGKYLTPNQGDASYLPASGEIKVNADPMTWMNLNGGVTFSGFLQRATTGGTIFGGSSGAIVDLPVAIEPTLPTVLAGKTLTFVGVEACYNNDGTTIDQTRINLTTNTSGSTSTNSILLDATDRTDDACRTYAPTAGPHVLAPNEDVSLEFDVNYSANAQFFTGERATFIFQL